MIIIGAVKVNKWINLWESPLKTLTYPEAEVSKKEVTHLYSFQFGKYHFLFSPSHFKPRGEDAEIILTVKTSEGL